MSWKEFDDIPEVMLKISKCADGKLMQRVGEYISFLEDKARSSDVNELTGLSSRSYVQENLVKELKKSTPEKRRRSDTRRARPLSAGLLDLDGFKNINDTYGHGEGDRVLTETAKHFVEGLGETFGSLRDTDIVANYGGDEILIVLPDTEMIYACVALNKIKDRIQRQENLHDVTVSAGVTDSEIVGVPLIMSNSGIDLVKRYFEHEGLIEKNGLKESIQKYADQRGMHPFDVIGMLDNVYKLLKMTNRNPDMIKTDKEKILIDLMTRYADKALYRAKNSGKNIVCAYGKSGLYL